MKYWEIVAGKLTVAGVFMGLLQCGYTQWLGLDGGRVSGRRSPVHRPI